MPRLDAPHDRSNDARVVASLAALVALVGLGLGLAGAAGCALVGYRFDGYEGVGGSGGASSQVSSGTGGASSSSSTGAGRPCTVASDCDDHDDCTVDSCASGHCQNSAFPVDDGLACTLDSCIPGEGAVHQPKDCDDKSLCTTDACDPQTGACQHVPLQVKSDDDACTTDLCDPSTGAAVYLPKDACCPHTVCTPGAPLDPGACPFPNLAADCIKGICATLPTCCTEGWTAACTSLVPPFCSPVSGPITCGCAHSPCTLGAPLSAACDPCVFAVCAAPSTKYCCDKDEALGWNASCVAQAHNLCQLPLDPACN